MTDKKMIVNLDFRTLLFLDVLIMLFMLLSGKAEVTLIAFVIAGTALMVFGLYATVIRCTIVPLEPSFYREYSISEAKLIF